MIINLKTIKSEDQGSISIIEANRDIPFEIKRIYYTYNVSEGVTRGFHAHKELEQIMWCPHGSIEVLLDDGDARKIYYLDSPEKALLVPKGCWREMTWKIKDSVLCVAVSDYYDERDYIRDYSQFLDYVKKGFWKSED